MICPLPASKIEFNLSKIEWLKINNVLFIIKYALNNIIKYKFYSVSIKQYFVGQVSVTLYI